MNNIKNNITSYLDFFSYYENTDLIDKILNNINNNSIDNKSIDNKSIDNFDDLFGDIISDSDENNISEYSISDIDIDIEIELDDLFSENKIKNEKNILLDSLIPPPPNTKPPNFNNLIPTPPNTLPPNFNNLYPPPPNTISYNFNNFIHTKPSLINPYKYLSVKSNKDHFKNNYFTYNSEDTSIKSKLPSLNKISPPSFAPPSPPYTPESNLKEKKIKIFRKNSRLRSYPIIKKKINKKLFQQFNCPVCNLSFHSEESLNFHFMDMHTINQNNIPTSQTGTHICPICNNKYATQELLGEHFINDHDNYDQLCNLDNNESNGFPGFDLLEYIGMISNLSNKNIIYLINKIENCNICYSKYKFKEESFNKILEKEYKINNIEGYNSDSEIFDIRNKFKIKKNINYKNFYKKKIIINKRKIGIESRIIKNKKLLEIIDIYKDYECLPIKINCCNTTICKDCFKEYIKISNNLICPFCKHDHTVNNKYIYYYKEFYKCKKKVWIEWWKKHLDIFL